MTDRTATVLRRQLTALSDTEQARLLLDLIGDLAAELPGAPRPFAANPTRAFRDLGLHGRTATALRDRLGSAIGIPLPPTVFFDHPTPAALAGHLRALLRTEAPAPTEPSPAPHARDDEEIAIVGMACRAPGGVRSPEDLWRLVIDEVDAISPFPEDRGWGVDELYDPDPASVGKVYTRHGGFLHDAADFDAEFFGISPREAITIDPQHRVLLETSWEALEHAGIDPLSLRGSRTAVFSGVIYSDYGTRLGHTPPSAEGYLVTGSMPSVASGRVSYVFGLEGPAVTLDTACSSSLVTLHLACQSLRQGESTLALAGGVTVMSTPAGYIEFSRQRVLAPDGRCRSFSATAAGSSWSEGAGILVVERLSDAVRNGHRVLALVRGSAVNQDGASNGLTAPNGLSQQRVIRQALANAGLPTSAVDVVEAHGAGTKLGDPVEAQALLATYGQDRAPGTPLWLGSLKSNLGHTQAAAGVLGLIKVVQAMRHGVLPKSLHCTEPSPFVDWSAGYVEVLREARPWPATDRPRRAGISSFGISGTNAHVIVEQPPAGAWATDDHATDDHGSTERPRRRPVLPWVLSARSDAALRDQAARLADLVTAHRELTVEDVGLSLATTRAALDERVVAVGGDRDDLLRALAGIARGDHGTGVFRGSAGTAGRVAFVFPGQGSQWAGMAVELLDTSEVFRASVEACAAALKPFVDWSLIDVLRGEPDAPGLDRVDVVQPTLFAVMVSLAALWRACGVEPSAVIGHSQGEIAAAHVAGALTLDDAAKVVALRSKAILALSGRGGMASIQLPLARVRARLAEWGDRLGVSAVNSARSVVVSGDPQALTELLDSCATAGVRAHRIPVDYASHSAHVEEIRAELLTVLADLHPTTGRLPFYSSVTAEPIDTATLDPEYWIRNLRHTVEFDATIRRLLADGHTAFLELSPHPVLCMGIQDTIDDLGVTGAVAVGSLRRDDGGLDRFVASLAEAHAHGVPVDWGTVFADTGARPVDLPCYAFQRTRYWLESTEGPRRSLAAAGLAEGDHPLLSAALRVAEPEGGMVFTGHLSQRTHPWLADHAVSGVALLPGTAFVDLAIHAGDQVGCAHLDELVLEAPLVLPDTDGVHLQLVLGAADAQGRHQLTLHSRPDTAAPDQPWTRHATATLAPADPPQPAAGTSWPPPDAVPVPLEDCYPTLHAAGLDYGPTFQGLRACWRRGDDLYADVVLPQEDSAEADSFGIHPALLDAALHPLALAGIRSQDEAAIALPFSWTGVTLHTAGASALRVAITRTGKDSAAITATDPAGRPVVSIDTLVVRAVSPAALRRAGATTGGALYRLDWTPTRAATRPSTPDWTIAGRDAARLAGELAALGITHTHKDNAAFVLLPMFEPSAAELPEAAHLATGELLTALQTWLADDRAGDPTLVLLTRCAVPATAADTPDLANSALWGLIRSAQTENPGRFVAIDVDRDDRSLRTLPAALSTGQPQLLIRAGRLLTPKLTVVAAPNTEPTQVDRDGAVLISGGLGAIGGRIARHLAATHGVRHLVLVGRSGVDTTGLVADLADLGAEATIAACDIADPDAVASLVAAIRSRHLLVGVVHAAGVLDDGIVSGLSGDQLTRVLRPKVDGAWHLHAATRDLPGLAFFALFSSLSGTLGTGGQGGYAAANVFLDALATYRSSLGLPAVSLAWGLWSDAAGDGVGLAAAASTGRLGRSGVLGLSTEEGLALFDASLAAAQPTLVPMKLDLPVLRADPNATDTPALLRGLVHHTRTRRVSASDATTNQSAASLAERLAAVPEAERDTLAHTVVREQVAAVLGYATPDAVDPRRAFLDLGFDSLRAVELRNRLTAATGLRLPATLVFDYPNPTVLAGHLRARAMPAEPVPEQPAKPAGVSVTDQLKSSSVAEILDFIDNELDR
nr:type I polyketide synthase [Solihabitans fulvus]